jgi:hypothetical protein
MVKSTTTSAPSSETRTSPRWSGRRRPPRRGRGRPRRRAPGRLPPRRPGRPPGPCDRRRRPHRPSAWPDMAPKLPGGQGGLVVSKSRLVEGADGAQRARRLDQLPRPPPARRPVRPPRCGPAPRRPIEHLAVQQQGRADAAHAGPRVLAREQHLGPQVPLGHGQLPVGDAVGGQQLELGGTICSTSSTCSGAVPTTTASDPASW